MLDEATGRWGIRVNRVELKAVDPPATIQEAMEKQMRAERDRRAAILTAEGVKQSQILTAEGEKQSAVLKAEGARTAAILRAEGEAKAIGTVFQAIHDGAPDERLGEVPVAVVHCTGDLDEAGLRAFLEATISAFKVPERFVFSAEPLPKLGTGKIDRVALKALHRR